MLFDDMPDPEKELKEELVRGELAYDGKLLRVHRDVVRLPNGQEAAREWVQHPGASAILAIDDDETVAFVRQYRQALGRVTLELPAGKRDPGETHLECAKRELLEETGCTAELWHYLTAVCTTPGFSDEAVYLYAATGLELVGADPDPDEFLWLTKVPLDDAINMALDGQLTDGKTVTALLHFGLARYHLGRLP